MIKKLNVVAWGNHIRKIAPNFSFEIPQHRIKHVEPVGLQMTLQHYSRLLGGLFEYSLNFGVFFSLEFRPPDFDGEKGIANKIVQVQTVKPFF